ncbi:MULTISPECIES: winged helix-turn-helix transcriptional regulator [Streptomyces]|uniref:winged helix-turn-helix transcriptional regulator n=1 Tax=Streptomyces lycopersici TaxID=2974589 RepID=UPI0021CF3DC6|nr:winged helix-turn-helix transcriptional regulator [Streptomyces sp. NEAU-383]
MLIQQLRALESNGVVRSIVRDEAPPHVEYELTSVETDLATALRPTRLGSTVVPHRPCPGG